MNTLQLDPRQRAMLDEMGVKVWWPATERIAEPVDAVVSITDVAPGSGADSPDAPLAAAPVPAPVRRAAASPAAPAVPVPSPGPSPAMHAAASSGVAVLAADPLRLYGSAGPATGGWLVIADLPPEGEIGHGEPFAGDAGRLLDNMLRALRLHAGTVPVHLVRVHRGSATGQAGSPLPLAEHWRVPVAELAPRVVLTMGPLSTRTLLQSGEPLGKLRGRVWPLDTAAQAGIAGDAANASTSADAGDAAHRSQRSARVALVATYHPGYLLRNAPDKARAWADLCLAAAEFDAAGS